MKYVPGHVYWKDEKGVYLGCNDKQAQTLGLQFGHEVIGKTDFDLPWPKSSAKQFHANDQRIMRNGVAEAVEEKLNDEGGVVFSIKSPIKNEQGLVLGVLGISIDITDKKRAEQLQKEKEIAEKNAEVMNILSSSVAHEIRTPLSIVKINADIMAMSDVADYIRSPEEKKQFLGQMENIGQAIKECSQVIDMLLVKLKKVTTTASDTEKQELLMTCSIDEIIQSALAEYPFRKGEKELFHYTLNKKKFIFQGHARLSKHVLFNLIKNALNAIQESGKGEIFIDCHPEGKFNCLIFKDTASGVPEEYLPKIFDKFETTDDVHSGTGLGLAFCRLVMESFGGRIECRSELGQFTEFILFFPKVKKSPAC